jgi:hypothetical protein
MVQRRFPVSNPGYHSVDHRPVELPENSAAAEQDFFQQLDATDVCSLTLVAIAITIVGNIVSGMRPDQKQLGLKVGLGVFLLWVTVWLLDNGLDDPNKVFGTIYRGVIFGLITSGAVRTFRPMFAAMDEAAETRKREREWKREQKKREKERLKQEKDAAEHARLRQIEWERSAPERERQAREAEERRRNEEVEQHRRIEARAEALRVFNRHREVVTNRFTRKDFDEYVGEYMNDKFSADDVERRGKELHELIEYHSLQIDPPPKTVSLPELAAWFESQIEKIEEMNLSERMKRTMLSKLKRRYAEAVDRKLEDLEP